ncbi:MAG TPA: hypothetical protein VLA84_14040 [Microcoleus sp.]|nr:hypothetical protein [Microcoleus sp.]
MCKRTLANLSKLPDHAVDGLQVLLKGEITIARLPDSFEITRSRPHGHVATVLGSLKNTGLHNLIYQENTRQGRLVLAMIVARIIDPRSRLATARELNDETFFQYCKNLRARRFANKLSRLMEKASEVLMTPENGVNNLHLVTAWACENRLVLGQVKVQNH